MSRENFGKISGIAPVSRLKMLKSAQKAAETARRGDARQLDVRTHMQRPLPRQEEDPGENPMERPVTSAAPIPGARELRRERRRWISGPMDLDAGKKVLHCGTIRRTMQPNDLGQRFAIIPTCEIKYI